jgi:hypothetical protein
VVSPWWGCEVGGRRARVGAARASARGPRRDALRCTRRGGREPPVPTPVVIAARSGTDFDARMYASACTEEALRPCPGTPAKRRPGRRRVRPPVPRHHRRCSRAATCAALHQEAKLCTVSVRLSMASEPALAVQMSQHEEQLPGTCATVNYHIASSRDLPFSKQCVNVEFLFRSPCGLTAGSGQARATSKADRQVAARKRGGTIGDGRTSRQGEPLLSWRLAAGGRAAQVATHSKTHAVGP